MTSLLWAVAAALAFAGIGCMVGCWLSAREAEQELDAASVEEEP